MLARDLETFACGRVVSEKSEIARPFLFEMKACVLRTLAAWLLFALLLLFILWASGCIKF